MGLNLRLGFPTCYAFIIEVVYMGQKKCSCNVSNVFVIPKCPIKPPSCASFTRDCLKDPWGTQSLFPLKRKPSCRKKSLWPPFEHS